MVSDSIMSVGITVAFVYFAVYRKAKILGALAYIALGAGMLLVGANSADETINLAGIIIVIGGIMLVLHKLLEPVSKIFGKGKQQNNRRVIVLKKRARR